jgi:dTDP-4-dehydrorhamnose reductase
VLSSGADAYVVRSGWVYGASGRNFVKDVARRAREQETITVDDDHVGSPTWSLHLARGLVALGASTAAPGIYHCTNAGEATRYVLTRAVFAELGLDPARVAPAPPAAHPGAVHGPAYGVLSTRRWHEADLPEMAHWRDALHEAFIAVGEDIAEG